MYLCTYSKCRRVNEMVYEYLWCNTWSMFLFCTCSTYRLWETNGVGLMYARWTILQGTVITLQWVATWNGGITLTHYNNIIMTSVKMFSVQKTVHWLCTHHWWPYLYKDKGECSVCLSVQFTHKAVRSVCLFCCMLSLDVWLTCTLL